MKLSTTKEPAFRRLSERTENLNRSMYANNKSGRLPAEYPATAMLRTAVRDLVHWSGKEDTATLLTTLAKTISG